MVVNYALEKDIFEKAAVASYTKIFSSDLCKQRELLNHNFPFSRKFSSLNLNKTTATDFKKCRKQ